jgi:hypothetical protein
MPDTVAQDTEYTVVRNLSHTVAVFSALGKEYLVQWGSPRQNDGTDVQRVPKAIATHPAFQRAVRKGIFEITTEEAMEQAMQRQIDLESGEGERLTAQVLRVDPSLDPNMVRIEGPTDAIVITEDQINSGVEGVAKRTTDIEALLTK